MAGNRNATTYFVFAFILTRCRVVLAAANEVNSTATISLSCRLDFFNRVASYGFTVVIYLFQCLVELTNGHVRELGIRIRRIGAPVAVHRPRIGFSRHEYFIISPKDFTRIHFAAGREENTNFIIYYVEIVIGNDFSLVRISTIRIFRGSLKAFTKISLTSIHIRAVVVFNHVVERRRC